MQIFANCVGRFPCSSFHHVLLTMRGRKQLTGIELRADWNWNWSWNWLRVLRREDEGSFRWAERKTISEHCQLRLQEGSAGVLVCVCACVLACLWVFVCVQQGHTHAAMFEWNDKLSHSSAETRKLLSSVGETEWEWNTRYEEEATRWKFYTRRNPVLKIWVTHIFSGAN